MPTEEELNTPQARAEEELSAWREELIDARMLGAVERQFISPAPPVALERDSVTDAYRASIAAGIDPMGPDGDISADPTIRDHDRLAVVRALESIGFRVWPAARVDGPVHRLPHYVYEELEDRLHSWGWAIARAPARPDAADLDHRVYPDIPGSGRTLLPALEEEIGEAVASTAEVGRLEPVADAAPVFHASTGGDAVTLSFPNGSVISFAPSQVPLAYRAAMEYHAAPGPYLPPVSPLDWAREQEAMRLEKVLVARKQQELHASPVHPAFTDFSPVDPRLLVGSPASVYVPPITPGSPLRYDTPEPPPEEPPTDTQSTQIKDIAPCLVEPLERIEGMLAALDQRLARVDNRVSEARGEIRRAHDRIATLEQGVARISSPDDVLVDIPDSVYCQHLENVSRLVSPPGLATRESKLVAVAVYLDAVDMLDTRLRTPPTTTEGSADAAAS